jgi:hypothetical protein
MDPAVLCKEFEDIDDKVFRVRSLASKEMTSVYDVVANGPDVEDVTA